MKQSKDTFEAALEEQEESPPDSPVGEDELNSQTPNEPQNQTDGGHKLLVDDDDYDDIGPNVKNPSHSSSSSTPKLHSTSVNANVTTGATIKNKEYDDDEEEENVEVELSKFPSSATPKLIKSLNTMLTYCYFLNDSLIKVHFCKMLMIKSIFLLKLGYQTKIH
ncbi:hypothetical protein V6Z11_A05G094100 [Gossypium hirsutum]